MTFALCKVAWGAVVSTIISQQEGTRFNPWIGRGTFLYRVGMFLPWVLQWPPQIESMHYRFIGDFKDFFF